MGVVNVTQLRGLAREGNGNVIPIAQMPAISSENVTSSGASEQSAAFDGGCKYVRIATDTTVRILFGTNPTALATSIRLVADTWEYFGVENGHKVAVINE